MPRTAGVGRDSSHGVERLLIGKMPPAAHDPVLEKRGAGALHLHLRVVVAFDRQNIEVDKFADQIRRHVAQVGGESHPPVV